MRLRSKEGTKVVQFCLSTLGHEPGPIDGLWGPMTRAGWERWDWGKFPGHHPVATLVLEAVDLPIYADAGWEQWRQRAQLATVHTWQNDIIDCPRDRATIARLFIAPYNARWATDYVRGGRVEYCGTTVFSLLQAAGMQGRHSMASAGKVLHEFAPESGHILTPSDPVRPGDIGVHIRQRWNGHVMMALAEHDGWVLWCEGNHSRSVGPDGKCRRGFGVRVIRRADPYFRAIVAPNDSLFGGGG